MNKMYDHENILSQLMTELQGQIGSVSHQLTMMNECLEKVNRALVASPSIQEKIIVDLQEENALLRRQLTDFQYSHMELLADRRRRALESYKHTYEAAHRIRKGGETECDCAISNDCEEVIDEVDL